MEKQLFQNLRGDDRIEALDANATSIVEEAVERTLTRDKVETYRERLSTIQFRDSEIEEHLADYTKPLKDERKEIKTETRKIVKTLKKGFEESTEKIYIFADQESRQMNYYDSNGEFVKSRKMRPEERQTTIHNIAKTA